MLSHNVITLAPRQAATLPLESPVFAVTNPRISDLTRVDNDTPDTPTPYLVNEAAAATTVTAAASSCLLTKQPYISAGSRMDYLRLAID